MRWIHAIVSVVQHPVVRCGGVLVVPEAQHLAIAEARLVSSVVRPDNLAISGSLLALQHSPVR